MNLFLIFLYFFGLTITLPAFFSASQLLFFSPLLVLTFYQTTIQKSIWWALLCGIIIDLFSNQMNIGATAINYCLTTLLLYRYKFYFFEDRLSTLPLMTFIFSFLSMLIQIFSFYILGYSFILTLEWSYIALMLIPLQNALYAIISYTIPSICLSLLKKKYFFYNLMRRTR